jgi:hypothetical protein
MPNNNLADISMFESLQSEQHNRTNVSPMSVFNAFQIDLPDFIKQKHRTMSDFKYQSRKAAEHDADAWQRARLRTKKSKRSGNTVYVLSADSLEYTFEDKGEAEKALAQAKQTKVIEV